MGLERQLQLWAAVLVLTPSALGAILLLLGAGRLPARGWTVAVSILLGFAALAGLLLALARQGARRLAGRVRGLQHGVELVGTVHPEHRLPEDGRDELAALAREINRLADRLAEVRRGGEAAVAGAVEELELERERLRSVLEGLDEGVLVAAGDGRITLANPRAHALLGAAPGGLLGRSLADVLDAPGLEPGLAAASRVVVRVGDGGLEATATPLPAGRGGAGLIVSLRRPDGDEAAPSGWRGVGFLSGVAPGEEVAHRPDFYDFSLLDDLEREVGPASRDRPLALATFVVLDTETTGLRPEAGDRIVSLAAVRVRGGVVRRGEYFDALVHPGRAIPPASVRFHGITDELVAGAPPLPAVVASFRRFAGDAVLVGHEIWFDLAFLRRAGLEPSLTGAAPAVLDTHLLARVVHPDLPGHDLDALAARLGVPVIGRHSALGDALVTAEVLARLLPLLERRGIRTLGEAMDASRAARRLLSRG